MLRENSSQSPDDHEVRLEEGNNLGENQNPRPKQAVVQKKLFYEIGELLSSSALGAGIGYLLGGLIKTFVDLSKIGIAEMQKQSTEENAEKYIGINEYTIAGISLGSMVGVVTYIFVSELIKQRNEREMELQAVRDNVAENDNFNGALSERQELRIENGIANGDNETRIVGVDITVNGDTRHDLNYNPRHIMAVGEGNMNNRNIGSIFQLACSREASVDPANSVDELNIAGFGNLLREAREGSKKFRERELSEHEELQIEIANNFLKSSGYNNFSKNSPNLVFVMRPHEVNHRFEEVDDGRGVKQRISNINGDQDIQSLASPRGDIRGGYQIEEEVSVERAQSGKFVLSVVRAIEEGRINSGNAR